MKDDSNNNANPIYQGNRTFQASLIDSTCSLVMHVGCIFEIRNIFNDFFSIYLIFRLKTLH